MIVPPPSIEGQEHLRTTAIAEHSVIKEAL
jgi:hypothetical protein